MGIETVIVGVLAVWVVALALFVFYQATTPVPGSRFWRRPVKLRDLRPITWILVAQKLSLMAVVGFIFWVRHNGTFEGQNIVALCLYSTLVILAFVVLAYLRVLQAPHERRIRDGKQTLKEKHE